MSSENWKERALKAEASLSSMVKGHVALLEAEKYLRGRCNKAEAELRSQAGNHSIDMIRLEKAKAELERARPLLEAVEKCPAKVLKGLPKSGFSDTSPNTWTGTILAAAIAYRSAK